MSDSLDNYVVRFTRNGRAYDPVHDAEYPKGTNVIHTRVFWGVSWTWALDIAHRTGSTPHNVT
jgi:hypothetical protein